MERTTGRTAPASLVLAKFRISTDIKSPFTSPCPVLATVVVEEVVLDHLVLCMHPRGNPKPTIKSDRLWNGGMPVLSWCLFLVAPDIRVAWTRVAIFTRQQVPGEVPPLFDLHSTCMLLSTPLCHLLSTRAIEVWRCLRPCPLAN